MIENFKSHSPLSSNHIIIFIGMDKNTQSRVFEPFFSKQLGRDGIGLGLSIVQNVVNDLMQGEITIAQRQPQGCEVRLCLPLGLAPENRAS